MKKHGSSIYFVFIAVLTLIIIMPLAVLADPISWSSQIYTASTSVELWEVDAYGNIYGIVASDSDNQTGPPLPIYSSSSAHVGITGNATSEITSSSMINTAYNVNYPGCCIQRYGFSTASFAGNYTATTAYLQFTYDYVGDGSGWFQVNDLSNGGISLWDVTLNPDDSDTLYIPTPLGHNLEVNFGIDNNNSNGTLTYGVAVVPEPVSSCLFLVGGAFLACRRLVTRKV